MAQRFLITGTVQGVGFRPTVYRLATELGLTGHIYNTSHGVCIEIQGERVDDFLTTLTLNLPPLAKIETIKQHTIPHKPKEKNFCIHQSENKGNSTHLPTDTTLCDTCLKELFDPSSRYYLYPFITCTDCGPRYTLTHTLPYDRSNTSMKTFPLCTACQNDYATPSNRRYHAQTIACKVCGPQLSEDIETIAKSIQAGKIVALKSLGGYQLICDARNSQAIQRLRDFKRRAEKPFAIMVPNQTSVSQFAHCNNSEEQLLQSQQRPIVILKRKSSLLADNIAPGLNSIGIMLPYTATHYLLFHALSNTADTALVVTSANPEDCPMMTDEQEVQQILAPMADLIVDYNREITHRLDDSVMTIMNHKPCFIRRARGYVPEAMTLPKEIPPTLALGAYLKNTICVTRGKEAFISQPIGTLNTAENRRFFHKTIHDLLDFLNVKPECIAHDLHPDFYSTRVAETFDLPSFAIQHHHAHVAAVAAEIGLQTPALGLALDGFGLGEDQQAWGGELFFYDGIHYERKGHFKPLLQPGGDKAAKQPFRMANSVLFELGQAESPPGFPARTSSCGRLFDAASALLGVCDINDYEAQAAMQLESLVTQPTVFKQGWTIESNQLNLLPLFNKLIDCDATTGANLFHGTLAAALTEWTLTMANELNIKDVILAGGCFLNRILTELLMTQLRNLGLKPHFPSHCPPNDAGLSLGQAWIAGQRLMEQ